jgi:hypothetical protein
MCERERITILLPGKKEIEFFFGQATKKIPKLLWLQNLLFTRRLTLFNYSKKMLSSLWKKKKMCYKDLLRCFSNVAVSIFATNNNRFCSYKSLCSILF